MHMSDGIDCLISRLILEPVLTWKPVKESQTNSTDPDQRGAAVV